MHYLTYTAIVIRLVYKRVVQRERARERDRERESERERERCIHVQGEREREDEFEGARDKEREMYICQIQTESKKLKAMLEYSNQSIKNDIQKYTVYK